MPTFSLLTIHRINADGTVDGSWIQDHIGTAETAWAFADATSKVNRDIPIAVIPGLGGFLCPGSVFYRQPTISATTH